MQMQRFPNAKKELKVLLHDPVVKKGESSKLKIRYTGPFIITDCRPGFNYRLQHLDTGRDLRRPVHADRLRPLRELPNDYRLAEDQQLTVVAEGVFGPDFPYRILAGDPLEVQADEMVHLVDPNCQFLLSSRSRVGQIGGTKLRDQCWDWLVEVGPFKESDPFTSTAGGLTNTRLIMHVVPPFERRRYAHPPRNLRK